MKQPRVIPARARVDKDGANHSASAEQEPAEAFRAAPSREQSPQRRKEQDKESNAQKDV
jgi:hypothetical protein